MYDTSITEGASRHLPMQSAPIDRTPAGAAAFNAQPGVDASFDWGQLIGQGLQTALPIIASLF